MLRQRTSERTSEENVHCLSVPVLFLSYSRSNQYGEFFLRCWSDDELKMVSFHCLTNSSSLLLRAGTFAIVFKPGDYIKPLQQDGE